MPIGSFSNKVFTTSLNKVYTFDGLTRAGGLNIEEQEVEGQKPSTYIKGSTLEDVSYSILLIAQKSVDVEKEINDWFAIKDAAKPYPLVIGNRLIGKNKFLLVNTSVSDYVIDGNGRYLKAILQLQFKEFVRYGSKKDAPSTSTESKSSKKRNNTNANRSKAELAEIAALEKEIYGV